MATEQQVALRRAPRRRPPVATAARTLLAALVAGVACALPARLLMHAVARAVGHAGAFTWAGSSIVVAVFVVGAVPAAAVAALTRRRVRMVVGVLTAVLLFVPATGIAADEVGGAAGLSAVRWAVALVSGLGVYACVAAVPWLAVRLADRWAWPRP